MKWILIYLGDSFLFCCLFEIFLFRLHYYSKCVRNEGSRGRMNALSKCNVPTLKQIILTLPRKFLSLRIRLETKTKSLKHGLCARCVCMLRLNVGRRHLAAIEIFTIVIWTVIEFVIFEWDQYNIYLSWRVIAS